MSKQDLLPLFLFKEKGETEYKQAGAVITIGGESYKASSFIEKFTEAIEDDVTALVNIKEVGELTVAAYILLESLHRAGIAGIATKLQADPGSLFQAALCTAIGVRAGMMMPEDTKFETTEASGNFIVRNPAEETGEEADKASNG